ncbi:MAG: hypothetical protein QXR58_01895 [Candidatus Micrarchaeaceae archaeon]
MYKNATYVKNNENKTTPKGYEEILREERSYEPVQNTQTKEIITLQVEKVEDPEKHKEEIKNGLKIMADSLFPLSTKENFNVILGPGDKVIEMKIGDETYYTTKKIMEEYILDLHGTLL